MSNLKGDKMNESYKITIDFHKRKIKRAGI